MAYGATMQGEANDCTVRALSNASGMPYGEAHRALQRHGRVTGKGAPCTVWHRAYIKAGLSLVGAFGVTQGTKALQRIYKITPKKGTTLATIMPSLSKGKFIVIITSHALAVVDGCLIDSHSSSGNKSVIAVYKV